ncbi:hypothetical protein F5144DRAFT_588997 [Chaetomium tenue]|uniref:Uncharacterized protein n=1 Tax=Chaetomium tenue TaxID=1854479 RepID=A0ACB7PMW5_9PEZI|nr:hypothetical protein F5144DRAFT_588997 [Chaetomium globosum]
MGGQSCNALSYYADRSWVPITVVTTTLTIATICVCLRIYARAFIIRRFGVDDWAAVIAIVLIIGSGVMVALSRAIYARENNPILTVGQAFYVSIVLYNASLTATKLTFLLQYHRIFGDGSLRTSIAIIIGLVVIAMWSISQLLVVIFTCTPVPKFWHHEIPGTCIPSLPFWYINAAGNIVTDIIIFVLPLPALCRLNLRRGQKFALLGVFSLGFFTCAISVIRIQYLKLSADVTWDNVGASCWSIGEVCSGITCACLPTLRPCFTRCLPALRTQRGGGGESGERGSSGGGSGGGGQNKFGYRQPLAAGVGDGGGGGIGGRARGSGGGDLESASARGILMGTDDLELQASEERSDDRSGKGMRVTVDRWPWERTAGRSRLSGLSGIGLPLEPSVHTEVGAGVSRPEDAGPLTDKGIKVKKDTILSPGSG